MVSLSFGTANIGTKNKSAKLFSKILHFLLFWIPEQVGNDDREAGNDDFRHSQGRRFYVIAGLTGYLLEVRVDCLPL